MRPRYHLLPLLFGALLPTYSMAQCDTGELEVTIQVHTDQYGNETAWQLLAHDAPCGASPIFVGGNSAVTCASAGNFTSPNGGYGNNSTITTGPYCLTADAEYDIVCLDSFGDGQAGFTVLVGGAYAASFPATGGAMNRYTFTVATPPDRDMAIVSNETSLYAEVGVPVVMAVTVKNMGAQAVSSFGIAYTLSGGGEVTETITANIPAGAEREVLMNERWVPTATGNNEATIRITGVNGDSDQGSSNDMVTRGIMVNPEITDRATEYLNGQPTLVVVANADQDILVPRDLDFHPDASRNELWVLNKDVANTGGSTVRFTHPGEEDQSFLYQRDPAARHFLSLPTGIAMGDNNCFATSPGIYDANGNQTTTTPFTGPTLWSANPSIYAQNGFGPLGSHLDMLHVTPRSQGIAHERWNKYWVVDGTNKDVVMHDFKGDHGPGQDYHGNAIIHRYVDVSITRDQNNHIVSHCVMDKRTGWLYIVDNGGQRILRLNTRSGNLAGNPTFGPFETYVQYRNVTGATVEVIIDQGLQQPAGIDVVGTSLYVSDHSTGEIIIYDMANGFAERGRITATAGIMGIKAGPDGRLWYVNATNSTLVRVDPTAVNIGIAETQGNAWSIHPNPANNTVLIMAPGTPASAKVIVRDSAGRLCLQSRMADLATGLDVTNLPNGVYTVEVAQLATKRLIIAR